ncbi:DNA-binding response regulator [Paenibacillus sp. PK3_47]|nr:DNA-binding response regulator [Paenibacillus sp. PK3_47]
MKYSIMVIEDNSSIRKELASLLCKSGYEAIEVTDFQNAAKLVEETRPHLILLDINLPGIDGFQLCSQIRTHSAVPVIFVTSRNTDLDELMSITLGGDDFVTKPYNTAVLMARVASLLKRAYPETTVDVFEHKGVKLHLLSSCVEYNARRAELSRNELKIMHYLMQNKGKIVGRNDLVEFLWDSEAFVDDNTLSVNITRIRGKLGELGVEQFIHTKRGQGYLI